MSPLFNMNLEDYARQRMPGGLMPGEPEPEWLRRKAWIASEVDHLRELDRANKQPARLSLVERVRLAFARS